MLRNHFSSVPIQTNDSNDDNGNRRLSKRHRASISSSSEAEEAHRTFGVAPRNVTSCIQFCFPEMLCCFGCRQFAVSRNVNLQIDNRDDDEQMAAALLQRHTMCKMVQCAQPWKKNVELHSITSASMTQLQHDFIRDVHRVDPSRLELRRLRGTQHGRTSHFRSLWITFNHSALSTLECQPTMAFDHPKGSVPLALTM